LIDIASRGRYQLHV